MQTALKPRAVPVSRIISGRSDAPCEVAGERGVEQEAVAPVELLILRYDLRRERELVDEHRIGKGSEALAKRSDERLVAALACSSRGRGTVRGNACGIHTEGVLVVVAVPATPDVESRSAEKAPEEGLDHAGQRYRRRVAGGSGAGRGAGNRSRGSSISAVGFSSMTAVRMDGKVLAEKLRGEVAGEVDVFESASRRCSSGTIVSHLRVEEARRVRRGRDRVAGSPLSHSDSRARCWICSMS